MRSATTAPKEHRVAQLDLFGLFVRVAGGLAGMARGIKKHLKRLNAPKHWMLDKLGGVFVRSCRPLDCDRCGAVGPIR